MPPIEPGSDRGSAWRALATAIPDALLFLDDAGIVREGNPAAFRLFGRSAESLRGLPLDQLLAPGENGGPAPGLRFGGETRSERWRGCRGLKAGGEEFQGDVSLVPLAASASPWPWLILVQETGARDFETTQRLESAKMMAVATLAAGIANDFNNALAAISGSIEAARLRIVSQDRAPPREMLEAREATRAAARLVRRLLNFARPAPAVRRPIDPAQIVEDAAQVLRRDLDPRITLVTRLDHGDWAIQGDLEQLTDLAVSLGQNAIDAMPSGGVLTLSTTRTTAGGWAPDTPETMTGREFVRLEIRDTGRGIPADVLPRIFEPFFTTKEGGRGSGLGLSTAYPVLQQHEGGITVESAPGAGSTFQLFLPRTREVTLTPAVAEIHEPDTGTGTILLVDDEVGVRRPLQQALGLCGYSVIEARDGLEALRLHAQQAGAVDLVILDVKMPGMSGWDVLTELRRRQPELPVLLTSGYTKEDSSPPSGAARPDVYLSKPYDFASLAREVRRLLGQRRSGNR